MRVLVTGGAGFIGSHIVERLRADGLQVSVLDDLSTGRARLLPEDIPLYRVDLTAPNGEAPTGGIRGAGRRAGPVHGTQGDPAGGDRPRRGLDLDSALAEVRPEVIVHHAAQADVGRSIADPVRDAEVNVTGTIRLLQGAVRHGVRKVVYASSAAVYGEPVRLPINEEHPVRPLSPYGISKHTVEHYLEAFHELYGLDYTVLRYANVYGPRQGASGEGGVVATFAGRLAKGEVPRIFGDGEQTRDFVYVGDVAEANRLALEAGAGDGAVIHVSTGREVTVNELYGALREVSGREFEAVYGPARPGDIARSVLDNRPARERLGWEPKVSLREGLERTYAAVAAGVAESRPAGGRFDG